MHNAFLNLSYDFWKDTAGCFDFIVNQDVELFLRTIRLTTVQEQNCIVHYMALRGVDAGMTAESC